MLLISADRVTEFAELDPRTGELRFFSKERIDPARDFALVSGRFARVGGSLVCFFRAEGGLRLRVGGEEFEITDEVTSDLRRPARHFASGLISKLSPPKPNVFTLRRGGEVMYTLEYTPAPAERFAFDFTPFLDEEDDDFILFVHNVLDAPERRRSIWAG